MNNDNRVVSKLRQDIPNLVKNGYEIIIGLRDVFGNDYDNLCSRPQVIDRGLIDEMYETQVKQIQYEGADARLHFAIMEYETWMMALLDNFIIAKGGNPKDVFETAGVDYYSDFEQTVYHPYNKVQKVYQAIHYTYKKHEGDQYPFLSYLTMADYEALRYSGKCTSFRQFVDSILSI